MKKHCFLICLAVLLTFSLTACGVKDFGISAAAEEILSTRSLSGGLRFSSAPKSEEVSRLDDDLIRSYFGDAADVPDFTKVANYELYIDESKPTLPCEFGIFELSDESYAETFILYLKARIDLKIENAKMYPSVDTETLKNAKFTVQGKYVWYVVIKGENAAVDELLTGKTR